MRKIVVGVATAGLVAVGVPLQSAEATTCAAVFLEPRVPNVVIKKTGRASVFVSVTGYDNCSSNPAYPPGIWSVVVTAVNPGLDVVETYLDLTSGTPRSGTWTGALHFDRRNNVGRWQVNVRGEDSDQQVVNLREDSFKLRRDTRLTVNASPEPAHQGSDIRVAGHLSRLKVNLKYADFRNRRIRIYFKPAGSQAKKLMGKTRTDRNGRFVKTFAAKRSGKWFAYFPGSLENTNRWSRPDRVAVRS